MPYSEAQLEECRYNPVALRAYVWRVAMIARRRSLVTKREIHEHGAGYSPVGFEETYCEDGRRRKWADTEAAFSNALLENIDVFVRYSLERPPVCDACKQNLHTNR